MKEKIEEALKDVRVMLARDGGGVELVEASDDGEVKLKLTGTCGGCPYSQMTLKNLVEKTLKEKVPEIKNVISV